MKPFHHLTCPKKRDLSASVAYSWLMRIAASLCRAPDSTRYGSSSPEEHAISGKADEDVSTRFERCPSMATEEVHLTDPGEMQLPVIGPGAPHDGAAARLIERPVLEIGAGQSLQPRLARNVRQVEDKVPGVGLHGLLQETPLVDALVPGPQVLGVEVDVELPEPRQGRQAAAEVLPGVVLRGYGDAGDVRLGLAVRAREVELGYQGFHAEADLDVADVPVGRVGGQEVSCHDYVGEAEGEGVLEGLDALDVPDIRSVVKRTELQGVDKEVTASQGDRRS